ncbi:MAG: S9 family peptidase, partial [Bacteroidetes bacterium]|nr:S9 family peptidase [Bacteroidota bacterium]
MLKAKTYFTIIALALIAYSCKMESGLMSELPSSPIAEKIDSVLTIHGDTRIDPYFWMRLTDEQKKAKEPDEQTQKVLDYLNAENTYTDEIMKETEELQENLYDEIVGRIKQDDESVPYFKNEYWYYSRYEEGKEYPIHCRKHESLEAGEEIILNVNELAEGHDYYSASGLRMSPDNKLLAFGEDTISRRIYHIRFVNLETGKLLPDRLEGTTGSGAWANDNQTYFYTTKNKVSLLSEKIWRHKLGNDATDDVLVYHEKDPAFYIGVSKSKSDKYITIWNRSTLANDYHLIDADNPESELLQFSPREEVHEFWISHFEDKFYIVTNWDATNFRLMETSVSATAKENWKEVLPHCEDVLLNSIEVFKDHLVISERSNALRQIRIINQKTGEEHYMEFDEPVYVAGISTNPEFDTEWLRYSYSSMTTPGSTIDYDMNSRENIVKKVEEVVGGHDPNDYTSERLYVKSRDGVEIPVSMVYKKGMKKDGRAPTVLYGYGSYGATMDPWFSATRLSLLDRGFIYVIAHIRGGEALGRQ